MSDDEFRFAYDPAVVAYGRDSVAELGAELDRMGCDRALVVAGETTGTTPDVVGPVKAGLGDRLAGVFAETTTAKRLATANAVAERLREAEADAFVALGGGSSLDVATVARVLEADDRPFAEARAEFVETGTLPVPNGLAPLVAVPTTLAGADLSVLAGINAEREGGEDGGDDGIVRGGVSDERLMPDAVYYDPALVETTPHRVLCASAMNGFDKGVETLYARNASPVTDGTAMRGLRLLRRGLSALGAGERDEATLHDSVVGTMLVQYGISRTDGTTLSWLHAFGHGVNRGYDIQQGAAHGVVAPAALSLLFDRVDARRDLLAEGLGVDRGGDPAATAEAVVDAVREVRDALGLPERLRNAGDVTEADLPDVARAVREDALMGNVPPGFDPTVEDVEGVLRAVW